MNNTQNETTITSTLTPSDLSKGTKVILTNLNQKGVIVGQVKNNKVQVYDNKKIIEAGNILIGTALNKVETRKDLVGHEYRFTAPNDVYYLSFLEQNKNPHFLFAIPAKNPSSFCVFVIYLSS